MTATGAGVGPGPRSAEAAVPQSAADTEAAEPAEGVARQAIDAYTVFNDPAGGVSDPAIETELVELIDGAPEGSAIGGAMFSWTRSAVAEALARAQERGVEVELAIDRDGGGSNSAPDNNPMRILREANLTRLVFCANPDLGNTACIANRDYSINHNKFFTFSETGDRTDVVVVSSSNLTTAQTENWNNATVVHGDAGLHDFFRNHLDNMLEQRRDNNYADSPDGFYQSDASNVRVYFPPRADSNGGTEPEAATDVVVNRLKYITEAESGCRLDVAHAQFTGPRKPVADELIRIADLGCEVRVVGGPTEYIQDQLAGNDNITVRPLDQMHSKYIVFHGNYNGGADRTLLWTGSHNLTGPSLRNHDESMIRVERPEITSAYQDNFETIWEYAA